MSSIRIAGSCLVLAVALSALPQGPVSADPKSNKDQIKTVQRAGEVFQALVSTKDRGVPQELLKNAKCVAVFPKVIKAAVGVGGRYGKGVVTCRDASGHWGPVAMVKLTGGSWGLQLGGSSTELVLFFMTDKSAQALLDSKFTLGASAGVAAGPVGRSAEAATDIKLDAEIYSYARSKGLFAGISLEGASLGFDQDDTNAFYGAPVTGQALLVEHNAPSHPAAMDAFLKVLP